MTGCDPFRFPWRSERLEKKVKVPVRPLMEVELAVGKAPMEDQSPHGKIEEFGDLLRGHGRAQLSLGPCGFNERMEQRLHGTSLLKEEGIDGVVEILYEVVGMGEDEIDVEQHVRLHLLLPGASRDAFLHEGMEGLIRTMEALVENLLFGREVVVEGADGNPCGIGDILDGHLVESMLLEQMHAGLEDAALGFLGLKGALGYFHGGLLFLEGNASLPIITGEGRGWGGLFLGGEVD